ncbi:MAG: hypothetical protein ACRD8Z_17665 [Nitrososphaeraceae archaeon]
MMTIFNISVPHWFGQLFQQHKILQIDGFLTLLIMGIGYMIVPRFRNVSLPSVKFAYISFILVLISLIAQVVAQLQLSILSDKFFYNECNHHSEICWDIGLCINNFLDAED